MTNTDSTPFMDIVPAISMRENEAAAKSAPAGILTGPTTDLYATFSDKDFRLG